MKIVNFVIAALTCALLADVARAQDSVANYPNRPLRFIVPYPPGALTDVLGKVTAPALTNAELYSTTLLTNSIFQKINSIFLMILTMPLYSIFFLLTYSLSLLTCSIFLMI